jgi:FRG domain
MSVQIRRHTLEPKGAVRIGSVRTFLDALEKFERSAKSAYFFRGHSNFTYTLKPSIYRDEGWIQNEDVLFKELILRCPNDFSDQQSTFQTLVKMQHYSLPTRLLDLTANPLVALLFACTAGGDPQESGEVLVFRVPKREIKYFDSDTVSVISNISRRPKSFKIPSANLTEKQFNATTEIGYLLHEIKHEKPYFEPSIMRAHLESVICVKPKMDNPRIIRQDGAFLLFGVSETKMSPATVPPEYFASEQSNRILVIAQEKKRMLKQLEALGITQGTIYPEIERVAEYIKSTYKAKNES